MTVAEITELRTAAYDAYKKAIDASNYSINSGGTSRSITRQELEKLRSNLEYWDSRLSEANGTTKRTKFITHRD